MTCPDCERYKQSASMWRNKAYELNGTPLPWKPDELWVGLTDEEAGKCRKGTWQATFQAIDTLLREKNGGKA